MSPSPQHPDEASAGGEVLGTAFPILPTHDLATTVALFEALGFEAETYTSEGYAILRRGGIELHFTATASLDPLHSNGMAFVRLRDAAALYAELEATRALPIMAPAALGPDELRRRWLAGESIARLSEIEDKPWRMREFAVLDPSNNLIRFGQPLD